MSFRRKLLSGEPVVGSVVTLPDVCLAERSATPVDFIWIDLEHGALGTADVPRLSIAARAAGAAALVRLGSPDTDGLGAVLDAGVDGVVAPRVETAAQAARLVARLRYPPAGSRGFAPRRALPLGGPDGSPDLTCIVQIETGEAARRAHEIAAVDGVDALVVGCADMSLSLGEDPLGTSPALAEAVALVQDAAAGADLPSGIAGVADPEALAGLAGGRSTCIVMSADVRIYARALELQLRGLRGSLSYAPS